MKTVKEATAAADAMLKRWNTPRAYTAFVHQRHLDVEPIIVVAFAPGFEGKFTVPPDADGFAIKQIPWSSAMGSAQQLEKALAA